MYMYIYIYISGLTYISAALLLLYCLSHAVQHTFALIFEGS